MASSNYQELEVGAGETVVDGKTQWTDFITVTVPDRQAAFDLAMDILRQYDQGRYNKRSDICFNLTGVLRQSDSDED